ncbi:MAG: DUF1016 family protein [Eggerthellaceae bacterium]|nr:DUF1016 family protein [Eggerthellaceae bacterium]
MGEIERSKVRQLAEEIATLINERQYRTLKLMNSGTIELYWSIGEMICARQEAEGWGRSVVVGLSDELQRRFPGAKGYSAANLWRMRNFYLTYKDSEKLAPLVREIGWASNIAIMEKCKDDLEREFYLRMAKRYGWSKRLVSNYIEAGAYERYLLNQTNFEETLPPERQAQAKLAVKDEYTFDFAELSPEYSEHELELQLVSRIRDFLTEMGGTFTFVGNQYHLTAGERDIYIDLLLFHRGLRSLVAVELKIGEFEAEYAGKMQLYLSALDDQVRLPDENPSIGIIICKSKDRTYVEYALRNSAAPIGVSTYNLSRALPEELRGLLPSPEIIAERLAAFDDGEPFGGEDA